ncbi:MAG: hypothetical protein GY765_01960 [bacterium]|nr:hypothetical protein [bacterium]
MQQLNDGNVYWQGRLLGNIKEIGFEDGNIFGNWSTINRDVLSSVIPLCENEDDDVEVDEVEVVLGSGEFALKGIIEILSEEAITFRVCLE